MSLPDRESIAAQVKTLAEEARDNGTAVGDALRHAVGIEASVAAPIYLGKADQFIPVKYVLHFSTIRCTNCGCVTHESKFYAMNYIRSRVTGQHVKHMVPTDRALYNVPVERIALRPHTTPYCAECEVIDLSHLPTPPKADLVFDLEEPRLKGQKPRPAAEKKETKPRQPTADDLA